MIGDRDSYSASEAWEIIHKYRNDGSYERTILDALMKKPPVTQSCPVTAQYIYALANAIDPHKNPPPPGWMDSVPDTLRVLGKWLEQEGSR